MIKYVVLCRPMLDGSDSYVSTLDEEETAIWWAETFPEDIVMVFEVVLVS